jgi:hypothetical protein
MSLEDYEEGHAALIDRLHVRVPPWLKSLGYTNSSTGLHAVVDLADLLQGRSGTADMPFVLKTTTLRLFSITSGSEQGFVSKLTEQQWYAVFDGNTTKLTIKFAVPYQDEHNQWFYHTTAVASSPKSEVGKRFRQEIVGFMKATLPNPVTVALPVVSKPYTSVVQVTGDPEVITNILHGPTFRLPPQKTNLFGSTEVTGKKPEQRYAFFGKVIGKKKSSSSEKTPKTLLEEKKMADERFEATLKQLTLYQNKASEANDDDFLLL